MKAVADLVRERRIHSFTVEEVAQRAGVSYGTVYRHFPTRESLLEELYDWHEQNSNAPSPPEALDEVPTMIEALVAYFEEDAELEEGGALAVAALGLTPSAQRQRDDAFRRLVATAAPDLDPDQVRIRAAVIRHLGGSLTWAILRQRFRLSPAEISSGLKWALQALIQEVESTQAGGDRQSRGGQEGTDAV
jgi:AcrR family transcriptional regulator